jgi:serine/threonine protein kinase
VKPDIILLKKCSNGKFVKIADFGLAKVHDIAKSNTRDGGSLKYMAPEVVCTSTYNTKADIYSLEVISYRLQ